MIGPEPMCATCTRNRGDGTCEAFPGGIPRSILLNSVDHRVPQEGDGGLVYDPKPGAVAREWWPDDGSLARVAKLVDDFMEWDR